MHDAIHISIDKQTFGYVRDIVIEVLHISPEYSSYYDDKDSDSLSDDFIVDDSADYLPGGEWYDSDDFHLNRRHRDKEVNNFGRRLLNMCSTHSLHIL